MRTASHFLSRLIASPIASAALCLGLSCAPASADVALWSLESADGGRATLMGTVHLLPQTDEWQDKRIKARIKAADMLVLETLLDGPNSAKAQGYAIAHGMYLKREESLALVLDEAQMARLYAVEAEMDVPKGTFERMRPWFASLNMSLIAAMKDGFNVNSGAEEWLKGQFSRAGRAVGPLESPSAGLEALATLEESLQVEMLLMTLAQLESGEDYIQQLYEAWLSGDQSGLEALLLEDEQFSPQVHEAILVQRNASWVSPVLDYLKTPEEELIAVGAAHMIGPGNLIEMLRAAGVKVERLD